MEVVKTEYDYRIFAIMSDFWTWSFGKYDFQTSSHFVFLASCMHSFLFCCVCVCLLMWRIVILTHIKFSHALIVFIVLVNAVMCIYIS